MKEEQSKKPGRPLGSTKTPTKPVMLRLHDAHRIAWKELGGTRWARRELDKYIEAQKAKS